MQNYPRLTALLGAHATELTAASIDAAISQQIPEGSDLDWKEALYADTAELAKDVAALANATGGIIVLGVREKDGCADSSKPVQLSDRETRRMTQAAGYLLRPFLPGVKIRPLETAPGTGYYVITVPRSPNAPHAVIKGSDGHILSYPVRDETTTRWLSEPEIASRYRDRFLARSELVDALGRVHEEGLARVALWQHPWLAVSLVPTAAGHRDVGAAAVAGTEGFVRTWARNTAPPQSTFGNASGIRAVPGVRRTIITGSLQYQGLSQHPHAEFHYNGAGFAATYAGTVRPENTSAIHRQTGTAVDAITQDRVESHLLGLLSMLAHHAANTGSAGDCEVLAQLVLTQQTGSDHALTAAEIHEPTSWTGGTEMDDYEPVRGGIIVKSPTTPAESTADLDDLVDGYRGVVRTAHALAADILGEFGIAEPCFLRPDGLLDTHRLSNRRRQPLEVWAAANDLIG